jgi:hypothetical protein
MGLVVSGGNDFPHVKNVGYTRRTITGKGRKIAAETHFRYKKGEGNDRTRQAVKMVAPRWFDEVRLSLR